MKSVLLSILVSLITFSAFAESIDDKHGRDRDRGGHHDRDRDRDRHHDRDRDRDRDHWGRDRDRRPPPYFPVPPIYRPPVHHNVDIVYCRSRDYRPNQCFSNVSYVRNVRLRYQFSQAPCIYGRTYGPSRYGVWVSNGCEGQFEVVGRY